MALFIAAAQSNRIRMCLLMAWHCLWLAFPALAWAQSAPAALPAAPAAPDTRWWQLADPVFGHLTLRDGLPQADAVALAQDREGFLWVGTEGGLARWDGHQFRKYKPNPKDPGSLPDAYIQCLLVDQGGRLWVGSNSGGLVYFDSREERFIRVVPGHDENGTASTGTDSRNVDTTFGHASILALADDGRGGLWVGSRAGLDHLDPANGKTSHVALPGRPDEAVNALLLDRDARLWVGTSRGLLLRDVGSSQFRRLELPGAMITISSLMQGADGRVWIGTVANGAWLAQSDGSHIEALREHLPSDVLPPGILSRERAGGAPRADPFAQESINSMQEVMPGQVWLGTREHGIIVVHLASMQTRRLQNEPGLPSSLSESNIHAILRDRSGLVWVGNSGGLNFHDPQQRAVQSLFGSATRPERIVDPVVTDVQQMPDGSVWLGLVGKGINIIDADARRVGSVAAPLDARARAAWPPPYVQKLSTPIRNRVYIASSRGLFSSAQDGGDLQLLPLAAFREDAHITAMTQEGEMLWLGGANGLWQFDPTQPQPTAQRAAGTAALNKLYLTSMASGRANLLWIGTFDHGLYRYDRTAQSLQQINPVTGDEGSLSSNWVSCIFSDSRGWLWVGTIGGGINLLRAPFGKGPFQFRKFGLAQGLQSAVINKILEDEKGDIWASTDKGLVRIEHASLALRVFLQADGVTLPAFVADSGARTRQGELLFGGHGGVNVVQPNLLADWAYQPPVVITRLELGGKVIAAGRFNLDGFEEELQIRHDANSLQLEFAALDYSAPGQNRYGWRLDGIDHDWIDGKPAERQVSWQNLPAGEYRLHLRGSNRSGAWSKNERLLRVRVLPAWYATWWWRLLVLAVGSGIVLALVQWRTRFLRLRQLELESQVQQRTLELQQKQAELLHANQALNQANSGLAESMASLHQTQAQLVQQEKMASLGGLVAGIAHEVNTPLGTSVMAISGSMDIWKELRSSVDQGRVVRSQLSASINEGMEYTRVAQQAASRAAELITRFKSIAVLADNNQEEVLDLDLYLHEITTLLHARMEQLGCRLSISVASGLQVRVVPETLTEAMMRILNNVPEHAFDHGRTGCLRLGAWVDADGSCCIEIRDDGHGIAPADLPKVFDPFFTTKSGSHGHIGLGLHVAFNHVTQGLRGSISIASEPGQGTCVLIRLPAAA
jgi:ligand-binding sensor domain-containing protein/signal transduction histidine kinase